MATAKLKTKFNIGERRRKVVAFVLLTVISVLCALPLLWAFGTSFKKNALTDITSIIPKEFSFDNYIQLFSNKDAPVFRWMLNSVSISLSRLWRGSLSAWRNGRDGTWCSGCCSRRP